MTTGFFPCVDADTGSISCHSVALLCRIHCANDALLNCTHSEKHCSAGLYRCAVRTDQAGPRRVCLPDHLVCDGRLHCALGDDESPQLCQSRAPCPPGQFACRSPGHCLPSERRCDGHFDCRRPGLDDRSDETACPTVAANNSVAECSSQELLCDGFPDCDDGSDERNCPDGFVGDGGRQDARDARKPKVTELPAVPELQVESAVPSGPPALIAMATVDEVSGQSSLYLISSTTGKRASIARSLKVSGAVLTLEESTGRAILFDALSGHLQSVAWPTPSKQLGSDQSIDVSLDLGDGLRITDAAYDSTRRLLFYASEVDGSVGVVATVGGYRATLRLLDCPRGLLAHPESAGLFLAVSCGPAPGIYRLSMDGRELRLLLGSELVGRPIRFGFDSMRPSQRLYWIDAGRRGVFSVRLEDGGDVRRHFAWPAGQPGIETARIAVSGNRLFLAAALDGTVWSVLQLSPAADSSNLLDFPGAAVTMMAAVSQCVTADDADRSAPPPRCTCEQICLPVWDNSAATECLCDWRHRLERLPNFQQVRCHAKVAAKSAPSFSAAATNIGSATAQPTVDLRAAVLGVCIPLVLILAAIACVFLWPRTRCRRQSMKLDESIEPETTKLTSV